MNNYHAHREEIENQIWYALLDAEREYRYYLYLAIRNQRIGMGVRIGIAFLSIFGTINLFQDGPWVAQFLLSIGIVIGIVLDVCFDFRDKARFLSSMSLEVEQLKNEWRQAWTNFQRGEEIPNIISNIDFLQKRGYELSKRVYDSHIGINKKLNERCAGETYEVLSHEFDFPYPTTTTES